MLSGRLAQARRAPWVGSVVVLWIAQVVSEMAFSFALPFVPLYLQDLGVQDTAAVALWAGAMAGAFAVTMAVMGPVWGWVADRFGRKLMIQRALFGACVVIGAMGLVTSPEQLFALRVVQGGFTGVVAAVATVVSLTVPRHRLASSLGLMQAAMFLGSAIGPIVGGAFADRFGYRAAFGATGVLFLVVGLLVTFVVREPPREEAPVRAAGLATGGGRWMRPELLAAIVLMAVVKLGQGAPQPVLPLYVQGLTASTEGIATTVGVVVAVTGIASTVSALGAGRLADRYGRTATLVTCLGVATLLTPLHVMVGSVWQLVLVRAAMGLALGGTVPAVQALMTDMTPADRRGSAFGWLASANALGNGGGPLLGSLVAAGFGLSAAFLVTAPAFALSAWMVARLPAALRRDGTPPAPAR